MGALLLAVPAAAADASGWSGEKYGRARLIAAADAVGRPSVGVQIELTPGWKTYWRYPGDAGVPPQFDFSGSDNLRSALVSFPAPHRFADGQGQSIGYEHGVIFPVQVEPEDATRPIVLRMKLDYAVCEKLCVPAEARAELVLDGLSPTHARALQAARQRVPRAAKIGDAAAFAITRVEMYRASTPARVLVDVKIPDGQPVDLLAEGPDANWALPLPEAIAGAPSGHQRFSFALDGLPPDTKPDHARLRLTAISGQEAIETISKLD